MSIYGLRLQEKRKLKQIIYGLRDRQLKNDYIRLRSGKLGKEANILTSLESRIDSLVFRSGLVNSLPFARQLVVHKHFLVLSKKNDETMKSEIVKSPSYRIKPGQTVVLRKKKMTENKHIKKILEKNHKAPNYLTFDKNNLSFSCLRYPSAEELESKIKVNTLLIAE